MQITKKSVLATTLIAATMLAGHASAEINANSLHHTLPDQTTPVATGQTPALADNDQTPQATPAQIAAQATPATPATPAAITGQEPAHVVQETPATPATPTQTEQAPAHVVQSTPVAQGQTPSLKAQDTPQGTPAQIAAQATPAAPATPTQTEQEPAHVVQSTPTPNGKTPDLADVNQTPQATPAQIVAQLTPVVMATPTHIAEQAPAFPVQLTPVAKGATPALADNDQTPQATPATPAEPTPVNYSQQQTPPTPIVLTARKAVVSVTPTAYTEPAESSKEIPTLDSNKKEKAVAETTTVAPHAAIKIEETATPAENTKLIEGEKAADVETLAATDIAQAQTAASETLAQPQAVNYSAKVAPATVLATTAPQYAGNILPATGDSAKVGKLMVGLGAAAIAAAAALYLLKRKEG